MANPQRKIKGLTNFWKDRVSFFLCQENKTMFLSIQLEALYAADKITFYLMFRSVLVIVGQ